MEGFFKTHKYLVQRVESPIRRLLADEIDWSWGEIAARFLICSGGELDHPVDEAGL